MTTPYPNNLTGRVKDAIDEWNSISYPTKGLAETIVSHLHYHGYSYNPAKYTVADTFDRAANIAQFATDNSDEFDRDTCERLAANYLDRAKAIRMTGSEL